MLAYNWIRISDDNESLVFKICTVWSIISVNFSVILQCNFFSQFHYFACYQIAHSKIWSQRIILDYLWCFSVSCQPYLRYKTSQSRMKSFLALWFFTKMLHVSIFLAASLVAHFSHHRQLTCNTHFSVFGMWNTHRCTQLPIINYRLRYQKHQQGLVAVSDPSDSARRRHPLSTQSSTS